MDTRLTNVTTTPEIMGRGAHGMDPQEYADRELRRYYAVLMAELRTIDLTTPTQGTTMACLHRL